MHVNELRCRDPEKVSEAWAVGLAAPPAAPKLTPEVKAVAHVPEEAGDAAGAEITEADIKKKIDDLKARLAAKRKPADPAERLAEAVGKQLKKARRKSSRRSRSSSSSPLFGEASTRQGAGSLKALAASRIREQYHS